MTDDDAQASRIAELEADNRRLRRLLDQANAPMELRHRLRNTVALLRNIIRRSAETDRDLEGYVAHLEDRVDALARAQVATDEHGSIGLHNLLADELLHYGAVEGVTADLAGPEAELEPTAGKVFALALHELAVNSVEHGALGAQGRVEVQWAVETEPAPVLVFTWMETGPTAIGQPGHGGFGTEVLTRMLPYELDAVVALDFDSHGVRCTIRLPMPQRVGRLVQP